MKCWRIFVLGAALTVVGCGGSGETPSSATTISASAPVPAAAAGVSSAEETTGPISPGDEPATVIARTTNLPTAGTLAAEDWPQFRGAARDGIAQATALADGWPTGGPPLLWTASIGEGYAAPAVVGERVFLEDYDAAGGEWLVRCWSLSTGQEQWRYGVKKRIRPNHAITRSIVATDGGFVAAIDPKCEVHCLDARDGSLIWKRSLPLAYGTQIPPWYNGQCPLIDEGRLILATGGRVLMTAVKLADGAAVWETPNAEAWSLSHASIMPVELDGVRHYVYLTLKGAVGVDAATGDLLWQFPWQFNTAVPTSALALGDGKLLLTSAYQARTVVCQVRRDGKKWTAAEVVGLPPPPRGWNSEVHTPIVHRDRVFGVGKKQRGLWTCLDFEGRELWDSGRKATFGLGGYVLADGKFFVVEGNTGIVRVLDATADEYRELAAIDVLEGPEAWAPPVIAHGKLLVRDLHTLACLNVAEGAATPAATGAPEATRR